MQQYIFDAKSKKCKKVITYLNLFNDKSKSFLITAIKRKIKPI